MTQYENLVGGRTFIEGINNALGYVNEKECSNFKVVVDINHILS